MDNELQTLIARLMAHRYIDRNDKLARRALTDDMFRQALDERLHACGLVLLENPYAEHIAVGVKPEVEEAVFGAHDAWLSNNIGLPRDGIALLVIIWALIILPKRERQIARREKEQAAQSDMFAEAKPLPATADVSSGIPESALYADFGEQLGGRMRFSTNLGVLSKLGFISRRNKVIYEGPMLDLLIDYAKLAPRIIEGALGDVVKRMRERPDSQVSLL
ncbi:hypothetical protein HNQ59_001109 [Chitinivorax tropicus]|uniref:DUF4194 domain-containing protein n=1 Tax=Chitinivorax tropicus TaxID=714531 RepID=A0A840ML24_9PROT|nr:hypothetical protein [Chitinivorax tropicus]MBB5017839.1 hypothetical protein [Chitinivorax tropicus]